MQSTQQNFLRKQRCRRYKNKVTSETNRLVSQEATIFSGTMEQNITYGLQDYDKEEVCNVAEKSGCMEFLSN